MEIGNRQKTDTTAFDENEAETGGLIIVDGELFEDSNGETSVSKTKDQRPKTEIINKVQEDGGKQQNQKAYLQYIFLPLIFLAVALFGGLRIESAGDAFLFLKPPLVCLIFAVILLVLFFRASLIRLDGWFSESFSTLKNIANASIMLTLFAATVQIFNSLLPERGLPFWVFAFCFFWTLLNNLFSAFDTKRLLQSLGSLFGFAFIVKYLVLGYMTAPASSGWLQGILQNPTQEAFTWLLDLPRFSAATGYIQFFAVLFYLLGLFLLSPMSLKNEE
jgi:hypothetical protein